MDRIEAMKVFVTALDEGSLVAAARKLGRSAAAVTRAIGFLENHVGVPLLHRTTRAIRLSEAGGPQRVVHFTPRLVVNGAAGTLPSALAGIGVTRAMSYQIADHVGRGELRIVLAKDEAPPIPVHLVAPEGRLSVPKVRLFVDHAVPLLRAEFARRQALCS